MKIEQLNKPSSTDQVRPTVRVSTGKTGKLGPAPQAPETERTNATDTVFISNRAAEVSKLVSKVGELPDVRRGRVEYLRALVTSGAFQPTSKEIADSILGDEGK